jgi:uncharacterized membrane protein
MKPQSLPNTLTSFIGLGIFIVLLICAFIFLSYIFIIGAVIGLVLFLFSYFKARFGKDKTYRVNTQQDQQTHRVIDQD